MVEMHSVSGDFGYFSEAGLRVNSYYGSNDYPSLWIDGTEYWPTSTWRPAIQSRMATPSPITLTIGGTYNASTNNGKINAAFRNDSTSAITARVYFCITEDSLNHTDPNGHVWHNRMARDYLPDQSGEIVTINPGTTVVKSRSFTINAAWNENRCNIVPWFQADGSHNVYQTGETKVMDLGAPCIVLLKTTVYDSSGNNDGRLDPGETAKLTSTLQNIGGQDFTTLTTTISSSDPYVTIIDNSGYFGALKKDSIKENTSDKYTVQASASTPSGHIAPFKLIASEGSYADTFDFNLQIGPYYGVAFIKTTVYDSSGNNNGRIEPGETVKLTSTLQNTGETDFTTLTTTISSSDPYMTITDNSGYFGVLKIDSTKENTGDKYQLIASSSIPNGHMAECTLITSQGTYADTFDFDLQLSPYYNVTFIKTTIYDSSGNNNGRIDPGETVKLTSTLQNTGDIDFTTLTTTISSADPYVTITDNSGYFGVLKIDSTKENTGDKYQLTVSSSAPTGHVAECKLIVSQGTYVDTLDFDLVLNAYHYLVWNPDPTPTPGQNVDSILESLGFVGVYSTTLPSDLSAYAAIYVCLGMFGNKYVIANGSAEANALVAYLNNGGKMYMEGGDVWYFDPIYGGYNFCPLFGINAVDDGSGDLGPVIGETGTFTRSMSFAYGGDNSWVDHIDPTGTGFLIFHDGDNAYNCGVANNPGTRGRRTVGTSIELGLLTDAIPPSTRAVLLDSIMKFFQVYLADVVPPSAPHVRKVAKSGNNALITWNKVTTDTLGQSEAMDYYVVYRSTLPSFVPGSSDSIGVVVHPDTTYTDVNVLSTASSYYYLIKGVDLQDNRSKNSNMAYVFKKFMNENAATTDRNWVSLPWYNNYATMSALTSDLSPAGNPLVKVTNLRDDNLYESWIWDPDFGEWYGTDFAITSGRGYEMVTVLDTTVVVVGCNDPAGLVSLNENPATTDRNWVSIPYNHVYSTVSDITTEYSPLGNPLIKVTNLRDDNLYESWIWDPDFGEWYGTDFAITSGRGYEMVTIVDTTWNPTEYSNESGLLLVRQSGQTDMRMRLGTALIQDRAPVWVEDKKLIADVQRAKGVEQSAKSIGHRAGSASHIVRLHVAMKDFENLVFTAYCPDKPYDVLTENMVGSGIAEKSGCASLWFDVGNFKESWDSEEELLVIIEAIKQGRGYCAVVSLTLDRTVDIQDFGHISLVPISDLKLDGKNIIGYSVYKGDQRLNARVLTEKNNRLDNDIIIRPVFRGGYETVYGSCGVQSNRNELGSLSYGCDIVPNPCVEQVRVAYALPQLSFVELMVYDICGRQVKVLVSEQKEPGCYSIVWDGTDNAGHRVSSGVYFVRFTTGSYTRTEKILRLK